MSKKKPDIFFTVLLLIIICFFCGIRPMVIMSGSMEPALPTGSLCIVNTKSHYSAIEKGDIITYRLLEGKVTHRAAKISREGIITKGDANRVEDPGIVTEQNFFGKVVFYIPYVGYAFHYIKRNFICFMCTAALTLFMPWKKLLKSLEKKGEKVNEKY